MDIDQMDRAQYDIAVVGSFYNLSWLACELARQGWNVLYLDLYPQLGRWPTEDIEGPFGFFNSELFNPHFVEKYNFEEPYVSQDRGWTIWTPQGPIEFKSPLIPYQMNSFGINPKFREGISKSTEEFYKIGLTDNFKSSSFSQNWLEYLSHSLSQTEFSSYNDFKPSTYPLPLMNSFFLRSLSRRSLDLSNQWLANQNIKTSANTSILDLVYSDGKKISGFELKGEFSGITKFNSLIWGLSSEETYFFNEKIGKILFPKGVVEPEWVWSRYSFEIEVNRETQELPLHSVWIQDLHSPWTHENLLIVQRTTRDQLVDVWLKIPNTQRFNKDYLDYYGQKILEVWRKKFQDTKVQISHYPQEYDYTYQQLGPSRLVQFSKKSKSHRVFESFKNVYFSSYESLESLNKETLFHNHLDIITKLTNNLRTEKVRELE
jgi:hypothetical protein